MKSVYNFVVRPKGDRYNNKKEVEGGELILNTEIMFIECKKRNEIFTLDLP